MSAFRAFWNSPVGPKTTHFWGPVANWGFVVAVCPNFTCWFVRCFLDLKTKCYLMWQQLIVLIVCFSVLNFSFYFYACISLPDVISVNRDSCKIAENEELLRFLLHFLLFCFITIARRIDDLFVFSKVIFLWNVSILWSYTFSCMCLIRDTLWGVSAHWLVECSCQQDGSVRAVRESHSQCFTRILWIFIFSSSFHSSHTWQRYRTWGDLRFDGIEVPVAWEKCLQARVQIYACALSMFSSFWCPTTKMIICCVLFMIILVVE